MSTEGTVLASVTRAVIQFGASRGVDRARLLAACGEQAGRLDVRGGRVSRAADAAVWDELSAHLGTYGTGLAFAATAPGPRAYGVVALADMTSSTFGDALRRHCRHHRLLKEDVAALLLETPSAATVFLATPSGRLPLPPAMAEAAIAPYAVHARAWTGREVTPDEVRFEHCQPRDATPYEELFGCPVLFEQSVTCIRFAREVLDLPLVHAQREVCEFLDASADEELARLGGGEVSELAYRAVAAQLGHSEVNVASVARALGLGVRTLQRRLREEGVCLKDVVDTVRHHLALDVVRDPREQVGSISDRLGFSDPRAFRRAFARWTGMSPDRYRRVRGIARVA